MSWVLTLMVLGFESHFLYIVLTMPMKVLCYRLRPIFRKINSAYGVLSVAVLNAAIFIISEDFSKEVTLH